MKYEIYKDKTAEWRWRLKADNGLTVADSGESYHNKQDCLHGVFLVQQSGHAPVEEVES